MLAYYNEIDPSAAAWLRELITRGLIAPGVVDTRDIRDVKPSELKAYRQCHFFAGIGGWSLALRLAGWADHRPVWTGSCPCQPFSAAGRGAGVTDERHLWPHWNHLVRECRPAIVFGEQVASKDGLGWLDLVSADLERSGYAVGAADLCAAGVGAHHIRQRLYFVGMADSDCAGSQGHGGLGAQSLPSGWKGTQRHRSEGGVVGGLADADNDRFVAAPLDRFHDTEYHAEPCCDTGGSGTPDSAWRDADWLYCRDGKWRAVESSLLGVADGLPNGMVPSGTIVPASYPLCKASKEARRVMRLKGYGNAIVPDVARTFIKAVME